jgi:hypothetical protein
VRKNLFCLIANRASVPSVTNGKLGPGVRQGYAAIRFVSAAF